VSNTQKCDVRDRLDDVLDVLVGVKIHSTSGYESASVSLNHKSLVVH
jgi:hypothetical protein